MAGPLRKAFTSLGVRFGGYFKLLITTDSVEVVRDVGNKVTTLGLAYIFSDLYKHSLETGIRRGLQDERDDLEVQEVKPGNSLHVSLYCKKDERFLEVLEDYESGIMGVRLENELSQIKEIKIGGLKVEITNMDEVQKTKERIIKRMAEEETSATVTTCIEAMQIGEEKQRKPAIIIQGGAFTNMRGINRGELIKGTKESARAGYDVMTAPGGSAVDAVEEAVRVLEDNKHFNAGYGSFLNNDNKVECEAMIMDGKTMNTGAVMAVRQIANPVLLSRKIMDNTMHCALTGKGALKYARSINFPVLDNSNKLIDKTTSLGGKIRYEDFERYADYYLKGIPVISMDQLPGGGGDTVTVVAMDKNGQLACATSTGGMPGKLEGRVGDAPLVGCGGYANEFGAATTSGHGENIMKMTLAREIVFNMEKGENAQVSSEKAIQRMQERVDGYGGAVAIDKDGNFGKAHNTKMLYWASIKDGELQFGTSKDDVHTEHL